MFCNLENSFLSLHLGKETFYTKLILKGLKETKIKFHFDLASCCEWDCFVSADRTSEPERYVLFCMADGVSCGSQAGPPAARSCSGGLPAPRLCFYFSSPFHCFRDCLPLPARQSRDKPTPMVHFGRCLIACVAVFIFFLPVFALKH